MARVVKTVTSFVSAANAGGFKPEAFLQQDDVKTFLSQPTIAAIAKPILEKDGLFPSQRIKELCKALVTAEHEAKLNKANIKIAQQNMKAGLVTIDGVLELKFNAEKRYYARLVDKKGNIVQRMNDEGDLIPIMDHFDMYHKSERWLANKVDKAPSDHKGLITIGQEGDPDFKTVDMNREQAARVLAKRASTPVMSRAKGSDGNMTKMKAVGDHFSFSRG